MAELKGDFWFPGILNIEEASMTHVTGISPSVCHMDIFPQADPINVDGTLSLTYGGVRIDFPQSKILSPSSQYDSNGNVISIKIVDRRWMWQFCGTGTGAKGGISGWYNRRRPNGDVGTKATEIELLSDSIYASPSGSPGSLTTNKQLNNVSDLPYDEKTPQELFKLLLDAMGEKGYDVSGVPNSSRPEVQWDYDNPAHEMAELADQLACVIVLRLDNTVRIVQKGTGEDLPNNNSQLTVGLGIDAPARPDSLMAIGAQSRFQSAFLLEAVGLDYDGTIKPIDDLSYAKTYLGADGWKKQYPGVLAAIDPKNAYKNDFGFISPIRELALRSVYHWYRIKCSVTLRSQVNLLGTNGVNPFKIEGYSGDVKNLWQLLPIEDVRIAEFKDLDGTVRSEKAIVSGIAKIQTRRFNGNTPDIGSFINRTDWSINKELGIVEFSEPIYIMGPYTDPDVPAGQYLPAQLCLIVAHPVRDLKTRMPVRFNYSVDLPGDPLGTGPETVRIDELVETNIALFKASSLKMEPDGFRTNKTSGPNDIREYAKSFLSDAMLKYQQPATQQITYAGFQQIDLDGRILQLEWRTNDQGCETTASLNTEFDRETPNLGERRRRERANRANKTAAVKKVHGSSAKSVPYSQV